MPAVLDLNTALRLRVLPRTRRMHPIIRALALLAATGLVASCDSPPSPAGATEAPADAVPKAVFIIVDGIPADVVERAATPNIDALAAEGGYTRAWLGGEAGGPSESPTISAVGYQTLITGTWADKHNVYDNDVAAPDYAYWDLFRIAKHHDPALTTALFSTWQDNRTKLVGDGLEAAGGAKIDYAYDGLELDTTRFPHDGGDPELDEFIADIDSAVAAEAARYIAAEGPQLSWVYLQYTDDVAHRYGDGPEFDAAVATMDGYVGAIRDAVRERRAAGAEDWLILVTTDHGRDAVDGREHGEQSERERTIWIATDSRRLNERFASRPALVDVLPSIAAHLGLDIPAEVKRNLDGASFIDPRM
ncbi:MAG TPA: alkaline phosphatase family protein [Woeseiaceae bacterium]|nr:alkaline phosphatase family protein [Woeseiaceae bacterium]